MVPPLERRPWPTLGEEVCDWIEDHLVYGPGPLLGEPYVIEPEFRAELYRMYELYPKGHPREGRRRFKRAALVKRKGTAKSEKAALVAILEAHPQAPVRFDGWRREGKTWVPVGRPVASPYIPMLAYSKDQAETLAFSVVREVIMRSAVANDFDVGLKRVLVLDRFGRDGGKIEAMSGSPNSRDGARTTFQHFDEPHRMVLPRLREAHETMLENTFKRLDADPWSLETTTPGATSEHSVARDTHEYALAIAAGDVVDPDLLYVWRHAPETMKTETREQLLEALIEAAGPATWSGDNEALVTHYFKPGTDKNFFERVWLCRWKKGGAKAFDPASWAACEHPEWGFIGDGEMVALGFDGARRRDSTALVATHLESGFQQVVEVWERPAELDPRDEWEVPAEEVDAAVAASMDRWKVVRAYADPPYWDEWVDHWAGRWPDKWAKWWTNRELPMANALRVYSAAITDGTLSHDGDERMAAHIANATKHDLKRKGPDGITPLWTIRKERADSELKIDIAMAGCLSWEARRDAIAAGALEEPEEPDRTMRTR